MHVHYIAHWHQCTKLIWATSHLTTSNSLQNIWWQILRKLQENGLVESQSTQKRMHVRCETIIGDNNTSCPILNTQYLKKLVYYACLHAHTITHSMSVCFTSNTFADEYVLTKARVHRKLQRISCLRQGASARPCVVFKANRRLML